MNTLVNKVKHTSGQGLNDECITQFTIVDNLSIKGKDVNFHAIKCFSLHPQQHQCSEVSGSTSMCQVLHKQVKSTIGGSEIVGRIVHRNITLQQNTRDTVLVPG